MEKRIGQELVADVVRRLLLQRLGREKLAAWKLEAVGIHPRLLSGLSGRRLIFVRRIAVVFRVGIGVAPYPRKLLSRDPPVVELVDLLHALDLTRGRRLHTIFLEVRVVTRDDLIVLGPPPAEQRSLAVVGLGLLVHLIPEIVTAPRAFPDVKPVGEVLGERVLESNKALAARPGTNFRAMHKIDTARPAQGA